MTRVSRTDLQLTKPALIEQAAVLGAHIQRLGTSQLKHAMALSPALADTTYATWQAWSATPAEPSPAIMSFVGDIFSGLQVPKWNERELEYAQQKLRILSGLYGILRPLDGITPYRLEMGYRLPDAPFTNLYEFWGESIAAQLPEHEPIMNLTAVEYGKTVTKYLDPTRCIVPKFLTVSPKTGEPTFVTVHAKIARGAYAHWLLSHEITSVDGLSAFGDLGYRYDATASTEQSPVYVCQEFGGLGLSIRPKKSAP